MKHQLSHRPLLIALQWLVLLVLATPVVAQTFEKVYGARCVDEGYRGVEIVNMGCSGGGFISVGSAKPPSGASNCGKTDAYVVRTNATGGMIWEFTYDIGTNGTNDTAWSVKELPDGFIVVGTTERAASGTFYTQIFLMKLDCNGGVVWTMLYGPSNLPSVGNFYARDIIIAQVGDAQQFTSPGDFLIAGWSRGEIGSGSSSLLMRTRSNGFMIWHSLYVNPICGTGGDQLSSLAEDSFDQTGDVVGAGRGYYSSLLQWQGLIVHVNGHTGAVKDASYYGWSGTDEAFWTVIQIQNFCLIGGGNCAQGDYVFAGETRNAVDADMFAVRTSDANTCQWKAAKVLGDPGIDEVINDIVEYTPAGTASVSLTGYRHVLNSSEDVMVSNLVAENLGSGFALIYGGAGNDRGISIDVDFNGFIINGYSESNLEGANPPDPRDMYLVRTNTMYSTGCESTIYMNQEDANPPVDCWYPDPYHPLVEIADPSPKVSRNWGNLTCFTPKPNNGQSPGQVGVEQSGTLTLRTYPNPVKPNSSIHLDFTPVGVEPITMTVVNTAGEVIAQSTLPNNGQMMNLPISTDGWAAGAYLVQVSNGTSSASLQIIVAD